MCSLPESPQVYPALAVSPVESHSFSAEPVEIRRGNIIIAVAAQFPADILAAYPEYVGPFSGEEIRNGFGQSYRRQSSATEPDEFSAFD